MTYTARIPLAFWKVCCLRRQDGSLSATAFTLGQEDVTDLPGFEEEFEVAETQITIADLADLTGLDFGSLVQHDHFASADNREHWRSALQPAHVESNLFATMTIS